MVELLRYIERRLVLTINAPEGDVVLGTRMAHPFGFELILG